LSERSRHLSRIYRVFCDSISHALYENDPLQMGSSIGAPLDEYDEEAANLARHIARMNDIGDVSAELGTRYGDRPLLTSAISSAWADYRAAL